MPTERNETIDSLDRMKKLGQIKGMGGKLNRRGSTVRNPVPQREALVIWVFLLTRPER